MRAEEDHEQQEVDDGVDEHGRQAGLEVHEVDRALPAGHLQDAARAQQREQRRGDDRRRPVPHRRYPAKQTRPYSTLALAGRAREPRGRTGSSGTEGVRTRKICFGDRIERWRESMASGAEHTTPVDEGISGLTDWGGVIMAANRNF